VHIINIVKATIHQQSSETEVIGGVTSYSTSVTEDEGVASGDIRGVSSEQFD